LGRLHGAKLAAAHRGELRHPLPVGFVYDQDRYIVKDPDERVQGAVADFVRRVRPHRLGSFRLKPVPPIGSMALDQR
jgi:hypothetical protein